MAEETQALLLPDVRVPAVWTFAGLAAGLAAGLVLRNTALLAPAMSIAAPVGALWLKALQMTILPLVTALLFLGVVRSVAAAAAGATARRTLTLFAVLLLAGAGVAVLLTPLLLRAMPIPAEAALALAGAGTPAGGPVPGISDFLQSLVPANVLAAAAQDAMLPVILFTALFALAATRLTQAPRRVLTGLAEALAGAMMVIIGWVLALAPLGVFALALGVAASSGTSAVAALAHYIAVVSSIGAVVLVAAYGVAIGIARQSAGSFARAVAPAQAVAISTQSSLASLPAMLASCRRLGLSETSAEFVLPLAVALFRATGPAMNLAVAIYVAKLSGVALTPAALAAGVAVAMLTTLGSPSLPGSISFVTAIGPIALAMGVPLGPLALLVAVEVLPDIMRTLGNVTMDVAVTAVVDLKSSPERGGGS